MTSCLHLRNLLPLLFYISKTNNRKERAVKWNNNKNNNKNERQINGLTDARLYSSLNSNFFSMFRSCSLRSDLILDWISFFCLFPFIFAFVQFLVCGNDLAWGHAHFVWMCARAFVSHTKLKYCGRVIRWHVEIKIAIVRFNHLLPLFGSAQKIAHCHRRFREQEFTTEQNNYKLYLCQVLAFESHSFPNAYYLLDCWNAQTIATHIHSYHMRTLLPISCQKTKSNKWWMMIEQKAYDGNMVE